MAKLPFTFVPVPDFALRREDLLPGPLLLLGALLAVYDFERDEARVSQRALSRRLGGRDRKTIRSWLKRLEAAGVVRVLEVGGVAKRSRYRVVPPAGEGRWRRSVEALPASQGDAPSDPLGVIRPASRPPRVGVDSRPPRPPLKEPKSAPLKEHSEGATRGPGAPRGRVTPTQEGEHRAEFVPGFDSDVESNA